MLDVTPRQLKVLEQLFAAGFRPIAIPPYENALCVRRGECAAVLTAVPNGGLRLAAPPTYLVDGNLSVRIENRGQPVFVWKQKELEATKERLEELERFRSEMLAVIEQGLPL